MKSSGTLSLSLAANALLLLAVAYLFKENKQSIDSPLPPSPAAPALATNLARPTSSNPAAPSTQARQFDWREVESADYREYIANLRRIGCPEETIRDIIVADVNKLFQNRRRELKKDKPKFEFWNTRQPMAVLLPSTQSIEQDRALNLEKKALIKTLLGIEIDDPKEAMANMISPYTAMMDFLPESKQAKVLEIMQDYQTRMARSIGTGQPDADDMKNLLAAQKEMDAELARNLTPEEFEDYQLRLSTTAVMMRSQLTYFDPTEQEFRDVFKLRKAFEEDYPIMATISMNQQEREARTAAEQAVNEQIKGLLGDARYAEYSRAQDFTFQAMAKTAEKNNLPPESAIQVYDMKRLAEESAANLRSNSSLSQQDQSAALQQIKTETEAAIRGVFGETAYKSWREQPANFWLDNIYRAPNPTTAPGQPQSP